MQWSSTTLPILSVLALVASAAPVHGDVDVTFRNSVINFDVSAGSGPDVDRLDTDFDSNSVTETWSEALTYDAFILRTDDPLPGSARAHGSVDRTDELIWEDGCLVQLSTTMTADSEAEHLSGAGSGSSLVNNVYRIEFDVFETMDITLAGNMNPGTEYAEVRLHKVGELFDLFWFTTTLGHEGPFEYTTTFEPGSYWLEVDMNLFTQRLPISEPALETDSGSYDVTLTFGDGPTECAADLDGDGVVGVSDMLGMLAVWGACGGCPEDLNADGLVNVGDLLILLGAWGAC